ncbi:DUF1559 domain-containing protein [Lacipirellula parvula]|nr:DUF1559 domain-containing protein [Lacipirellula parvula]
MTNTSPCRRRTAFTLVELLVVIAIIGVLVALILPAVQAAREAARRTQCQNNLRQIGLALQLHHDAKGRFPAASHGFPLKPLGTDQYAVSWAFELLPYMEQQAMYAAHNPAIRADDDANSTAMRTPVSAFYCPTRRSPVADRDFDNDDAPSTKRGVAAGSDYAANSGTSTQHGMPGRDEFDTTELGPIYVMSKISARQVTDGLSMTYAVGEKYLPPIDESVDPALQHVRQGDAAIFSGDARHSIVRRSSAGFPESETDDYPGKFGSLHNGVSHFAFLDGSVHTIEHTLDVATLVMLSAIGDGGDVPDRVFAD